jgi:hypothetical protein
LHSDDERDPVLGEINQMETFVKHYLPWRSAKASRLVAAIDAGRFRSNFSTSRRRRDVVGPGHPSFKISPLKAPLDLPIDCYDLAWYNSLDVQEKCKFHPRPPIFLPHIDDILTPADKISHEDLLNQYQELIESEYDTPERLSARFERVIARNGTFRDQGTIGQGLPDEDSEPESEEGRYETEDDFGMEWE